LTFEQVGFSLSNQDIRPIDGLSSLFDQMLGSVPYLLRLLPYFRWQRHATEEMPASALGQIGAAPRAQVHTTSERIGAQFRHAQLETARQARGHDVIRAEDEQQGPFLRGETLSARTVQM
jgi:hypothetical protein